MVREVAHVLFERRRRVVSGDGLFDGEVGKVVVGGPQLLDRVAQFLEPVQLRFGCAQNAMLGVELPHVQAEWYIDQPAQRCVGTALRHVRDQTHRSLLVSG